jgi:hypothetical protein
MFCFCVIIIIFAHYFLLSQMGDSFTWTEAETEALISLWPNFEVELRKAKRNRIVYEKFRDCFVAAVDSDHARGVTSQKLQKKLQNLRNKYYSEKNE